MQNDLCIVTRLQYHQLYNVWYQKKKLIEIPRRYDLQNPIFGIISQFEVLKKEILCHEMDLINSKHFNRQKMEILLITLLLSHLHE